MNLNIGVMGGAFDPPHAGHVAIAHSFVNSDVIDQLWVLPTPVPPHKQSDELTEYRHRLEMTKLCYEDEPSIQVDDFESGLPAPQYTYNTLQQLSKSYSHYSFKLCIGEDSLSTIKTWYKWEELLRDYDILVAKRPGFKVDPEFNSERIYYVDHQPSDISSTKVREVLNTGRIPDEFLCEKLPDYIKKNRLYFYQS